jgi:L-lysine exporter family protein LysE/ArgO
MPTYTRPLLEGFILSAGLIVGLGPQNTLVLRQGLRRQHLLLMVVLCTLVDAFLIGLGTVGLGALLQGELLTRLMTYAGAAALLYFGARSLKAAFCPACLAQEAAHLPSRKQMVMALLAVSLLNPSVYIDTLLLIGGSAARFEGDLRLWFATGAAGASLVWFLSLGYGSALLAPLLGQPKVLRALDLLSGGILWLMAFRLLGHGG